jgi:toxic protein SymE
MAEIMTAIGEFLMTKTLSKTQRHCIVGYRPNCGDTSTPAVQLKGKWLREAGFETGVHVTVQISKGCIVLIPDNDTVHELRVQLEQARAVIDCVREGVRGV